MPQEQPIGRRTLVAIGCLTFSGIVYETSLTRVFSVAQGYHFAYLVVSIALVGIGAAGSWLFFLGEHRTPPLSSIGTLGALFSLSALISYALVNLLPFDLDRIAIDMRQPFYLLCAYALFSIPFFFSGLAVALAVARAPRAAGRVYFADLLGAGLGGVSVLAVLSVRGGVSGVIAAAAAGSITALILKERKAPFLVWTATLVLFYLIPPPFLDVRVSPYKELSLAKSYPESTSVTYYNAISRVDLIASGAVRTAPGLSLKYLAPLPPQIGITTDAEGLTAVTEGNGRGKEWGFLPYLPSSLPYLLGHREKVLILSLDGGMETAQALRFGAHDVWTVEKNPLLIHLMKDKLSAFTAGLFSDPRVHLVGGTSREFLSRTGDAFDLIVLSSPTTLGASRTGVGGIGEDYTLTEEGIGAALARLAPGGYLAATLYLIPPPREELRLFAVVTAALENGGLDPLTSTVAIRSWGTITYLFKKGDVTSAEIEAVKRFSDERLFDPVYFPGIGPADMNRHNVFSETVYENDVRDVLDADRRGGFFERYLFDVGPVTDDRPFFRRFLKIGRIVETYRAVDGKWTILLEGGYLVWVVAAEGLLLSIVFIVLPAALGRGRVRRGDLLLLYPFLAFGLSFIFLEISLIRRLILLLGEPTTAVSVTISSLLVAAGFGSLTSARLGRASPRDLLAAGLGGASLLIAVYALCLPPLIEALIGLGLAVKYALSALIIFPVGFIMGFPFPSAIRYLEDRGRRGLVPYAWCINGTASVVAAPLSMIVALGWGFSGVMAISSLLYLSGLLFLAARSRGR
jgi:hypothetical protein